MDLLNISCWFLQLIPKYFPAFLLCFSYTITFTWTSWLLLVLVFSNHTTCAGCFLFAFKARPVKATVFPVVMYRYESWTVKKAEHWRTDAFELWRRWRRLLRVPWTSRRSNKSILKEISPEYSLERLMLKLQYFGYLMWRANKLEKTLMLGKIEGKRRKGWQSMRWLDSITDSVEIESCSVMSNFLLPHGLYSMWNSPSQNTRVGSLSLLQGIFWTQESYWGLPHYGVDSLQAESPGKT